MKPIIFGGTASHKLAQKIAQLHHLEIGQVEMVTFANSEIKVTIQSKIDNRDAIIVQSTANPANSNLMELLFTIDALRRQGAASITAIIPYFGYARQNQQHRSGECVSLNVVVRMLEALKVDKLITFDLHDEGSSSVFSIPFENKSALPYLAKQLYQEFKLTVASENQYLIGSPDQGGIERARVFAESFYQKPQGRDTITVEKKRNLDKMHQSRALEVFGNVKGKHLILVDDVSTSGGTILNAANLCLREGVRTVSAVVVHPDFAKGVPALIQASSLTHFFTTNTIENTLDELSKFAKIKVYDIAPAITGIN